MAEELHKFDNARLGTRNPLPKKDPQKIGVFVFERGEARYRPCIPEAKRGYWGLPTTKPLSENMSMGRLELSTNVLKGV